MLMGRSAQKKGDAGEFFLYVEYNEELKEEMKAKFRARFNPSFKKWKIVLGSQKKAKEFIDFCVLNAIKMSLADRKFLEKFDPTGSGSPEAPQENPEKAPEESPLDTDQEDT